MWANPLVARKENETAQTGASLRAAKAGVFDLGDKPQRRFSPIGGCCYCTAILPWGFGGGVVGDGMD
ncbi:MAG: hypothetical protein Fur0025_30160 [Oscillatoriaceae cyanobacterium]